MAKKKILSTEQKVLKKKLNRVINKNCFNTMIVVIAFITLILSGGCGGGSDNPSNSAISLQEEQSITSTATTKKIPRMSDAEALKDADGLIDTADIEFEQTLVQASNRKQDNLRSVVLGEASDNDVSSIEEVIVPANVSLIGMNAFDSRWSSLKRVIITDTSVKLSYRTFNSCPNLEEVYIGDGTSSNYFDFKSYISSHASDSYSYPEQAFYNCPKLKCVSFGNVAPPDSTAFIKDCGKKVGGTVIEAPYAKYSTYSSKLGSRYTVRQKTWLESFPDTMLVNQISIPGTHDSCTFHLKKYGSIDVEEEAETQRCNLEEQLSKGVRLFDLRPFHEGSYSDPVIHHGPISCELSLHDAISILCNHLKDHPKDFLIVLVNHEGFDAVDIPGIVEIEYCEEDGHDKTIGDKKIQEELRRWMDAGYAVDFKPNLTVKDMRGKMLFISRDRIADVDPVGAYTIDWGGLNYNASLQSKNGQVNLIVQDKDKYNDAKLQNVKTVLDDFAKNVRDNHSYSGWCINQTSSYYDKVYIGFIWVSGINYPYAAEQVNGPSAAYISSLNGPTGIIIMDFAGYDDRNHYSKNYKTKGQILLDAIINHNF